VLTALLTVQGSLAVARRLALPRNDAFRLARGFLQLAFGAGEAVLTAMVATLRPAAMQRGWDLRSVDLLRLLLSIVVAIGCLVPDSNSEDTSEQSAPYISRLFAALAPRDESRLAWLAAIADAALACYPPGGKHGGGGSGLHAVCSAFC
jgi:hypothetical protein